jgi:hypothetical protein
MVMLKTSQNAVIQSFFKKCLKTAFFLLVLLLFLGVETPTTFFANAASVEVLDTDVTTASDGCIFLGVSGNYYTDAQAALDRINAIRYEACVEGVPNPNNPSKSLTTDDYVPLKWSTSLEKIARVRAAEASFTIAHARLNGGSIFNVSFDGLTSSCEDLAWDYVSSNTMVYAVNLWYEEKDDWLNECEGVSSGNVTGHYTSMINPKYTYVGLGDFYNEDARYYNTTAAEFTAKTTSLDTTMLSAAENIIQKLEVNTSYVKSYSIDGAEFIGKGNTMQLNVIANVKYSNYTCKSYILDGITYKSSNTSKLTVDSNGVVKGIAYGSATVTAYNGANKIASIEIYVKCANGCDLGDYDSKTYVVSGTCDICGYSATYTVPSRFVTYWRNTADSDTSYGLTIPTSNPTGSDIVCWVSTLNGDNGYSDVLVECSDTSLLEVPERITSTGNYKFHVLGAGVVVVTLTPEYNSNLKKTYKFTLGEDGSIAISKADMKLQYTSVGYTGSLLKPTVTVTYGGVTLTEGTHYSLTYSNNKNLGTATVTVIGKGIFKGTKVLKFTIIETAHAYGSWSVYKAATCTQSGVNRRYCTICNGYESKTVAATGHKYTSKVTKPNYTSKGYTTYTCSVCNYSYKGKYTDMLTLTKPTVKVANASTGVKVTWSNTTGATGYYVYRKAVGEKKWTKIKTYKSGSTVSCIDTTAKSGTTYYYTVKAYAGTTNQSSYVTNVSIKYLAQPTVTLKNTSAGVNVSWTKTTGASGYYVYRKAAGDKKWTRITTITTASKLSYTDKTAKSGTTYYYTVKAYSGSVYSSYVTNKSIKYKK